MATAFDTFLSRFGGQPLGAYNPFSNTASQYAPAYTPGPFTPPVVPGSGGGGGNPLNQPVVPAPGQQAGLPANTIEGQHGGGGVGGHTSTNTGGAFGLGQTTAVDRTGGTINTAQNQEATLGNIAQAALNASVVAGANPLGLANTVGGIVMDPNNPPLGGLVGGLLGGGGGLAQERETRQAAGGLLSGAYKADAQYGAGTTGLLGNRGGSAQKGNSAAEKAKSAASAAKSAALGNRKAAGGASTGGGKSSGGGGGSSGGGGSHSSSGGSRSSGGTKGNRAK